MYLNMHSCWQPMFRLLFYTYWPGHTINFSDILSVPFVDNVKLFAFVYHRNGSRCTKFEMVAIDGPSRKLTTWLLKSVTLRYETENAHSTKVTHAREKHLTI